MTHNNLQTLSLDDLQTSEIRYRRLFESARDGILILDAETRKITDVNPYMSEILGYTKEEFLGKELWEIGLLKDEEASIAAFEELRRNHYIRYEDLPLKSQTGKAREVEFISNVYTENDRQVIQCNIRDITERKAAEEAVRQTELKYFNLIESSPGILYLSEPNHPYSTIYVCPKIRDYGYSPEELYEKPGMWLDIIHEEDRECVLDELETAHNENLETDITYRIKARDGTIYWWQDKGRYVFDEQGNKTGWQGIILDVTKTKELEHRLRQSQKLESVGRLAGGIAHDFNNMLTAINGYSELALHKLQETDSVYGYIKEIQKAGQRSAELTHQLLAFSRQQLLQPVVVDLNEIIVDTIRMLQRLIGENIQMTTLFGSNVGKILVDPGQFSQIITNLAVNARDAMPQGGKLTVETSNVFLDQSYTQQDNEVAPGKYTLMTFSDTGTGMSNEVKQNIFEPFFTTKEFGQGTGLGLPTVYGIVKQSGGHIEVFSEEGIGTTFKIYLPRVEVPSEAANVHESLETLNGTETILLVEDEELVCNISKEILEIRGYKVITACNGLEALEVCDKNGFTFDLLMTDIVMPKMGGRELANKIKARMPHLPILFTSGYTDDLVISQDIIENNTNFIQKPFTANTLAEKIRQIFDNSSKTAI